MDMYNCLNRFAAESLFDASAAMLSQLKIKFTPKTREPIPFRDMYLRTLRQMPKALENAYAKVADCYFVGAIDEDSLAGRDSSFEIGERTDEISEGKYCSMLVFAVDIKPDERLARSEIATLTRGFNRLATALPVILFVRNGDSLSLAAIERSKYTQAWRNGEKLGKVSILRDINVSHPHRGHIEILNSLGDKAYPSFEKLYEHWFSVFSSDLLTKKFYSELSDWYAWAVQTVRFPNDLNSTETDSKHNNESVIRLITRLIFVWFLKQKHLIPNEFFNEEDIHSKFIENFDPSSTDSLLYDTTQSKYYRLILQNLFFAMLNRPIVAEDHTEPDNRRFRVKGRQEFNINNLMRYEDEFKAGGAQEFERIANLTVPFLNGGLFECLDKKSAENGDCYYDGFSERKASLERLYVPDCLFFGGATDVDLSKWYDEKRKKKIQIRGLIDILQSYCFTVEENTPLDQEVSLDPELLGKVFENLLASYNPETQTNARKQTGSFYTPRQIVQYMVDESLVAHLCRVCGSDDEKLYRDLLSYTSDAPELDEAKKEQIISALYSCKVLDPACGSGAFPMGILQQMVHALRKLDPENTLWHKFVVGIATDKSRDAYETLSEEERNARLEDIKQSFNRSVNDPDYARKLYLIENCIYGVDIQPIAIQISKLRCFISLVAEQKPTNDAKSNFGIRPLPNLEAKFVAANTLISLNKGHDNLFHETDEIRTIKKQLSEANHKLFLAKRNADKRKIREAIRGIRERYKDALVDTGAVDSDSAMQLANWDMFEQNASAEFFNSQWMFGVSSGFDIVIGNPPYIQLQKAIDDSHKLGDQYIQEEFDTFAKTGDIYALFYEQGWRVLKQKGHLCYITSNKWMRAGYGEKLRGFFVKNTNPEILIDFGGIQIFNATVDTNILLITKGANTFKTRCCVCSKQDKNSLDELSDFVQHNSCVTAFASSDSWVILSPIEQSIKRKIEAAGTPLRDWDISIYRGILTGCNEAFIISTEKRNEILANCRDEDERKRTGELIRPILRGRDIRRYSYDWAGLYLIATFPSRHYDIEEYPAVKQYLLSFGKERLEQTGREYVLNGQRIKSRKKTNNKWFETQDSIGYWEDFFKPKIIYPNMTQFMPFVYDEMSFLTNQKCFILTGENSAFLTAFFNSELFKLCFKDNFPRLGDKGRELSKIFFDRIPVIQVSEVVNDEFKQLLRQIQEAPDNEEISALIEKRLSEVYNLTSAEIETVSSMKI